MQLHKVKSVFFAAYMNPMKIIYFIITFLLLSVPTFAQKQKAIQLSGVVMTDDSRPQFIPYAHVLIKSRGMGTTTASDGFFSIAVMPGDTVQFSSIGFKRDKLYISNDLNDEKGYLVQIILARDTTLLQEVVIYPWPSPDQLKYELLNMRIPTTELDIAQRNLAIDALKDRALAMGYDASEISRAVIRLQEQQVYDYNRFTGMQNGGQAMLLQLSNPFAWLEFFDSLKRGDYKKKKR
jgi:hypothetical protein